MLNKTLLFFRSEFTLTNQWVNNNIITTYKSTTFRCYDIYVENFFSYFFEERKKM